MLDLDRVLITGGAGMIGRVFEYGMKPSSKELDVTKMEDVFAWAFANRPAGIIHLAAIDLPRSEKDPDLASKVNMEGAFHLACVARELRIPMLAFSTCALFNGKKGDAHDEDAKPDPLSVYARTKYQGELLMHEACPDALILRAGWVFGGSQAHNKKFVDTVIEKAKAGEPIRAVTDRWGSPTYVEDLVEEATRLLQSGEKGIVHVVNDGSATAYDMAQVIVEALGSKSVIEPVTQDEVSVGGPPRGISEVLVSHKVHLRSWREALREYVAGE